MDAGRMATIRPPASISVELPCKCASARPLAKGGIRHFDHLVLLAHWVAAQAIKSAWCAS